MSTDVPKELRENLAKYLNDIKDSRKLGFNQLSSKSGINAKSLNLLLNGATKRINPYQLQKIAQALRIDYKSLYKIVGYLEAEDEEDINLTEMIIQETMINIPVYDSLSDGVGGESNSDPIDFVTLPEAMTENCVIINIYDDSMRPTLQDGCRILVKKNVEINEDDMGVFIHNGEMIVKRYKKFKNRIYLCSDNLNYPSREVRKEDSFCICGKVIWVMNKV